MNFALYSCNWTAMDLKLKNTVLLAMRMNDANQLMINASPNKIINLQLFSGVIIFYILHHRHAHKFVS